MFQGELLASLPGQIAAVQTARQEWILTPHLGPHPLLADAMTGRP
jgi:hypothetical protein